MEKVMASVEAGGIDAGVDARFGLLCDIELDATLQFGSREMPLREVLGTWWSWTGMCRSQWIWWLETGLWHVER
jgi:hypothetical protein